MTKKPRPALLLEGKATLPAKKVQTASALSQAPAPNQAHERPAPWPHRPRV